MLTPSLAHAPSFLAFFLGFFHSTPEVVTFSGLNQTITRSAGNWTADGFVAGQVLEVSGTAVYSPTTSGPTSKPKSQLATP